TFQSSSCCGAPNTAIHPVWQPGKTLFAGNGTNTWLLLALTATECAVPRGAGNVGFGVLNVGTTWTRVLLSASMTPSTGLVGGLAPFGTAPGLAREAVWYFPAPGLNHTSVEPPTPATTLAIA